MAASRGRTLAVLVTLRALGPGLGYTFFFILLCLLFFPIFDKNSSFLPVFYRLCSSDADFFTAFLTVYSDFIVYPSFAFELAHELFSFFRSDSIPPISSLYFNGGISRRSLPSASGYRCLRQLPITGSRIRID